MGKGLTQNNSSSDSGAASKPKQEPPRIVPGPREPPERDPVPPPKRPRPASVAAPSPSPAQNYKTYDDGDIQEVVPVKSEPRDPAPAPAPMAVHHTPMDNSHPVSQYEVVQQQQPAPPPMEQNTVAALDESYGDESYDDGSGMIDPNTGMPMQGTGADGNKVTDV